MNKMTEPTSEQSSTLTAIKDTLCFANRRDKLLSAISLSLIVVFAFITPFAVVRSASKPPSESIEADIAEFAVVRSNFPDPCLLQVNNTWYAFATSTNPAIHIQVASAADITQWSLIEGYDAMPVLPEWALKKASPQVWAPQVVQKVNHPSIK